MFQSPEQPSERTEPPPTPARIIELLGGFMIATLFTAIDVGLFAAAGNDGRHSGAQA
jgi:hypothetical protein